MRTRSTVPPTAAVEAVRGRSATVRAVSGNSATPTTTSVQKLRSISGHRLGGSVAHEASAALCIRRARMARTHATTSNPTVTPRKIGREASNHPAAAKLPSPKATATSGPMQHSEAARADRSPPARIHDCFDGFIDAVYTLYPSIRSTNHHDHRRTCQTSGSERPDGALLRTRKAVSRYPSVAGVRLPRL